MIADAALSGSLNDEATAWESGCESDIVRNEIVIPRLTELFSKERPAAILDVGAGTGFISRTVDESLDYRPKWTLVDVNRHRLDIALAKKPPSMNMGYIAGDFLEINFAGGTFDAAILAFTLLECSDFIPWVTACACLLRCGAVLFVAMPDTLRDVLKVKDASHVLCNKFLSETISIEKIDSFTKAPYPFFATRTETLISTFLQAGFVLEALEQCGEAGEVLILAFRLSKRRVSCEH